MPLPFSRATVTGGAGFIGSNLVLALLQEGVQVTVIDNFSSGKRENLSVVDEANARDHFTLVEGDIRDEAALERAVQGADVVFHLAALGSVPASIAHPRETHDINATGSLQVFLACQKAGVKRCVVSSTSALYGESPETPKDEGLRPMPLSPYASSKLAMESYAGDFTRYFGVEVAILRYFNVFGPRQDPHSIYAAVIPIFVHGLLAGQRPKIFGDGEQTRDFIHVSDVAHANMLAASAPTSAMAQPINVAGGHAISVNRLFSDIRTLLGSELEPDYQPERLGDVRHSVASIERAREWLGFAPKLSVSEGLARSIAWYRADFLAKQSR